MTVARRGPEQVLSSYPGSFSGYTVDSKEPGPSATGKEIGMNSTVIPQ